MSAPPHQGELHEQNLPSRSLTAAVSFVAGLGLVLAGSSPASTSESSDLAQLVQLNPGMTAAQVRTDIAGLAKTSGQTEASALAQALEEARSSANENTRLVRAASSSGGGGTTPLGSAKRTGDVFCTPSSTLGVNHGHSGLYSSRTVVVEAPGRGKVVRTYSASKVKVKKGAKKQYAKTSSAKRAASRKWAVTKRGKAYNMNFFNNKKVESSKYNCSQLVWAAYKRLKVDLDGNGGSGVYPRNIRDSKLTTTYKTFS